MQARLEGRTERNSKSDSMKNPALEWKSISRRGNKRILRFNRLRQQQQLVRC